MSTQDLYRSSYSTGKIRNQLQIVDRGRQELGLIGSNEPISSFSTYEQQYNLEIYESPIRNPELARQLLEIEEHSYVARACMRYAAQDSFCSSDGSDRGFTIAKTLADGETPTPDDVINVALDLLSRRNYGYNVIGGFRLQEAVKKYLMHGNCYFELGIEREGISPNKDKDYCIAQTQFLPTYQMFNIVTPQSQQVGYEQRENLTSNTRGMRTSSFSTRFFPPWKIVDFCHDKNNLYGRSIYWTSESRKNWARVKQADENLFVASNDLAHNPTVHKLPPNTSTKQKEQYQHAHKRHKQQGLITDYYIYNDAEISKMQGNSNPLEPYIETLMFRHIEMVIPGMPLFYFPEFSRYIRGSRELNNQPALNYSRLRNGWCGVLADGIRKALDVELLLRLGKERYEELMYEHRGNMWLVQFPKWNVADYTNSGDDAKNPYDDLDGNDGDNSNGNGNGDAKNRFRMLSRNGSKPVREDERYVYL